MSSIGHHRKTIEGVIDRHNGPGGGAGFGDLDQGHYIADIIHPAPSIFLGNGNTQKFKVGQLFTNFCRMFMGSIQASGYGFDFSFGELASHLPHHLLFFS